VKLSGYVYSTKISTEFECEAQVKGQGHRGQKTKKCGVFRQRSSGARLHRWENQSMLTSCKYTIFAHGGTSLWHCGCLRKAQTETRKRSVSSKLREIFFCGPELCPMILILELNLDNINVNQRAKYLDQRLCIAQKLSFTLTHPHLINGSIWTTEVVGNKCVYSTHLYYDSSQKFRTQSRQSTAQCACSVSMYQTIRP